MTIAHETKQDLAEIEDNQQLEDRSPTSFFLRIEPSKGWTSLKLRELWEYRELLYFLVWRDIKVRYKQTVLGASWAIIQPFFTIEFGQISPGVHQILLRFSKNHYSFDAILPVQLPYLSQTIIRTERHRATEYFAWQIQGNVSEEFGVISHH